MIGIFYNNFTEAVNKNKTKWSVDATKHFNIYSQDYLGIASSQHYRWCLDSAGMVLGWCWNGAGIVLE